MAYQHVCDICGKPILYNFYASVLVEESKDRGPKPWHDARKYDICNDCLSVIKTIIDQRLKNKRSTNV